MCVFLRVVCASPLLSLRLRLPPSYIVLQICVCGGHPPDPRFSSLFLPPMSTEAIASSLLASARDSIAVRDVSSFVVCECLCWEGAGGLAPREPRRVCAMMLLA